MVTIKDKIAIDGKEYYVYKVITPGDQYHYYVHSERFSSKEFKQIYTECLRDEYPEQELRKRGFESLLFLVPSVSLLTGLL